MLLQTAHVECCEADTHCTLRITYCLTAREKVVVIAHGQTLHEYTEGGTTLSDRSGGGSDQMQRSAETTAQGARRQIANHFASFRNSSWMESLHRQSIHSVLAIAV